MGENTSKIGALQMGGSLSTKFPHRRGRPTPTGRLRGNLRLDGPVNADSIHTKELCSRLSSNEVHFYTENGPFALLNSLCGLRGNVYCSS